MADQEDGRQWSFMGGDRADIKIGVSANGGPPLFQAFHDRVAPIWDIPSDEEDDRPAEQLTVKTFDNQTDAEIARDKEHCRKHHG